MAGLPTLALAVVAGWCGLALPSITSAHPELEEQLARVSAEIARSPFRAEPHLRRGHLYRVHRDWQKALEDFRRASKLDPQSKLADRAIGQVYLESGQPQEALVHVARFLERQPGDPEGLLLRGRASAQMGATLKAAADFDAALAKLARPTPEDYVERARVLLAGGEQLQARALSGLEEGIEKLGNLYTLHRYAAELEIGAGRPEAALRRVGQLVAKSGGHLDWRILEAELLASMGRIDEARTAYLLALKSIVSLPPHRRKTQAISELETRIRGALGALPGR